MYGIERTLVDMIKKDMMGDLKQLIPALKRYASYQERDINRLYKHAKLFNVEVQVRNYMGALL